MGSQGSGEIVPWPLMTPEENAANGLALIHGEGSNSLRPVGRKPTPLQSARDRLRNACRQKTVAALNVLHEIMTDPKAPQSARLRAACEILDRGWGKPAQEPPEVEPVEATAIVDACTSYRAKSFEEWQAMRDREIALAGMVDDPAMALAIRRAAESGHSPATVAAIAAESNTGPSSPAALSDDDWLH